MSRRRFTAAWRGPAFRASWAVVSRAQALTGHYGRLARRNEARAREHGYSMLDLDDVRPFAAA